MEIAVVGAGVAGLSAAWLLSRRYRVTLFEREPRLGGHSNTVDAGSGGGIPIDTGFIVYNTACYPNLIALFDHLGVATAPTSMSFAVSLDDGAYEYNGNGFAGYFGQGANLFSPRHWRMAADILRFFKESKQVGSMPADAAQSLGSWLEQRGYSEWFIQRHIVPMGAAIWSTPATRVLDFPAMAFVRFFANHGLLQLNDRPEWRTVRGGSRVYVSRLAERFDGRVAKGDAVVAVTRAGGGVAVRTARGQSQQFDRCLLACHADEALAMLKDADSEEISTLGGFRYFENEAVLHRDARLMPRRRALWSSWNYTRGRSETGAVSLTYWMNSLQPLGTNDDYFVSLNPQASIGEDRIVARMTYTHPLFDDRAIAAQARLWPLQGRRATWFAGSYFAYGFHEDALQAGLAAAEGMGDVRRPWTVAGESDRLNLPAPRSRVPVGAMAQ